MFTKLTIITTKVQGRLFDISVYMNIVVVKILQGSAVTQTVLGGLTIYTTVVYNVYVAYQKLWKTVGSRQISCNNNH